jgi:carbon storage regulator CsrA
MLVLSRRPHEKICIPAIDATIHVAAIKPGVVRVAIDAPPDVKILRGELSEQSSQRSSHRTFAARPSLKDLLRKVAHLLKTSAVGLGVAHLQFDAGLVRDGLSTLVGIQDDLRLLRYGVEGALEENPRQQRSEPCRALLVEDDRNERELLAGFLRRSGLEVHTAGDGGDALDYLRGGAHPDVVLLDMGLPRCDGATMVREIRGTPALQDLKIFAVSGYLPEEFDLPQGRRGIDRWFQKPLDPNVLLQDLGGL